jgi:DNA-binding NarL/FixJ family response regulator
LKQRHFEELKSMAAPADAPINVLIADSSPLQLQLLTGALRRRPEFSLNASELDVQIILQILTSQDCQVIVLAMNHNREALDFDLLRRLHVAHPSVAKIILLQRCDPLTALNAFRAGARGLFCLSDSPFRALCKCIQVVHRGEIWASAEQIGRLVDSVSQVPSLRVVNASGGTLLTPREEQVVALVAEGLQNRDIAHELQLSEHTVKKYLLRIFDKVGISTRVELVLYAVTHGEQRAAEWLGAGRVASAD